jgi:signal peptidase I
VIKHVGTILSSLFIVTLCTLCVGLAVLRVSGFGVFVVTGGSMEPNIAKGSLVLVEPVVPSAVRVGDVVTFTSYDEVTTHRVIAIEGSPAGLGFRTKGDSNEIAETELKTFPEKVGVLRGTVPLVGYALAYAQAYWRLALTAGMVLMFFGCASVLFVGRAARVPQKPRSRNVARLEHEDLWTSHLQWLGNVRGGLAAAG